MPAPSIPYTAAQMPALIAIWNAALAGAIPLGAALWRQNIDGDPLFTPSDCLIAAGPAGQPAGFALTRRVAAADLRAYPALTAAQEQGYLLALAVDPRYARQGIGTRLLHAAAAQLRAQGATRIVLGGGPGHLVPGVPHAGASGGFWARHDYRDPQVVADVRGDLRGWVAPPRPPGLTGGAFAMRQGRTGEEAAILTWLDGAFPGDWPYGLRRSFAGGYRPSDVTLLVDAQAAIQGFCCTFHPTSGWLGGGSLYFPPGGGADWGGLGPLGIAAGVRGQGLGQAIVAAGLAYLQSRGVRRCGIDWIVLREFYGQLGFQVWQEYDRYEKPLDP